MTEIELRNCVISKAKEYLYYNEKDGSHKRIVDIYNSYIPLPRGYAVQYSDPWCATYVSSISIILEYTDIMPVECGCNQMIDLYKKLGRWQEDDAFIPQPGDVIFYDWEDSGEGDCEGYPEHVGIIVEVYSKTLKVIEGNKSNAVGYREIAINGRFIRGYGIPAYESKASEDYLNENTSIYIVKEGDTLSAIANMLNIPLNRLIKYNDLSNPDYIQIGQSIKIPHENDKEKYIVKKGDTLSEIAIKFGISVDHLMKVNEIQNKNLIYEGEEIIIN